MKFHKLTTKLRKRGVRHPKRLAAWIGMKKYGKKGMKLRAIKGMRKAAARRRLRKG